MLFQFFGWESMISNLKKSNFSSLVIGLQKVRACSLHVV